MANYTLGKMIGKVKHSFSIKNDRKQTVQLTLTYDYSTTTDEQIRAILAGATTIRWQNAGRRSLSRSELLEFDGMTILASDAGKKVKSREEQIAEIAAVFISKGIPEDTARSLAETAIDNPAMLATMVEKKQEEVVEDDDSNEEVEE